MTGALLLPLIAWSIEDRCTLRIRYLSFLAGLLYAATISIVLIDMLGVGLWVGGEIRPSLITGAVCAGLARLGLPLGDALALGYVGMVLGVPGALLVLVVTFALLFMIPRERAADMPAIPLIAAVSGVVACGTVMWDVLR